MGLFQEQFLSGKSPPPQLTFVHQIVMLYNPQRGKKGRKMVNPIMKMPTWQQVSSSGAQNKRAPCNDIIKEVNKLYVALELLCPELQRCCCVSYITVQVTYSTLTGYVFKESSTDGTFNLKSTNLIFKVQKILN